MKKILLVLLVMTRFLYADCHLEWDLTSELEDYYSDLMASECDSDFKQLVYNRIKGHKSVSYDDAREIMFEELDNRDGEVCSVYSDKCVKTWSIPNHTVMNCEHTWPQSLGATGTAKSDLHHLYPVMSRMNSRRGNFPFCEVDEVTYEEDGSALGYSSQGTRCFEPQDEHKGDLARSMFYFSIRYNKRIDGEQEEFFRKWNEQDPVSQKEIIRNQDIFDVQKNRNPFVDNSSLIENIDNF